MSYTNRAKVASESSLQIAQVYAAIAQAEALERIADALEKLAGTHAERIIPNVPGDES